ncbi:hypothetical protein MMC25_006111 [Agyrium rufum]|nr:hypothetical protein [Agyrium rufum]
MRSPIKALHANLLVKVLDEFAVQIEAFPNIMFIMHKIVEDMAAAIREGTFEGELQYIIMLTMVYPDAKKKGKMENFISVLDFITTPDLRNWVLKSREEKNSMDEVKVKLTFAEHQHRFDAEKYQQFFGASGSGRVRADEGVSAKEMDCHGSARIRWTDRGRGEV